MKKVPLGPAMAIFFISLLAGVLVGIFAQDILGNPPVSMACGVVAGLALAAGLFTVVD